MNGYGASSPAQAASPFAGGARLEVGFCTDPGREPSKQVNEDSAYARDTVHGHLAVVCDGMGGHVGGKEASSIAVETIFRTFDEAPAGANPPEVLAHAIRAANHAVWTRGQSVPELAKMGSTCVAVLTHGAGTEIAHVGDSRVYLITQGQAYQVTKDHSLVQRLVDANMLTPEEAANHPNANQITNALGMRADVEVEVRPQPFPFVAGDTFLLCSDGLSDEIGPADFLNVLAPHPTLDVAARQMVDLANARGGHDNITVVLVRVPGGGPFTPPIAAPPGSARTSTPIATPIAFPSGGAAPTTTMETAAAGATPLAPAVAPAFVPPPAPAFVPPSPSPYAGASAHDEAPRKGKAGVVIAIVLLLALLGGGAFAAWHFKLIGGGDSSPDTSSSSSSAKDDDGDAKDAGIKKKKADAGGSAAQAPSDGPDADAPTPSGTGPRPQPTPKPDEPPPSTTTTATATTAAPMDTTAPKPQPTAADDNFKKIPGGSTPPPPH